MLKILFFIFLSFSLLSSSFKQKENGNQKSKLSFKNQTTISQKKLESFPYLFYEKGLYSLRKHIGPYTKENKRIYEKLISEIYRNENTSFKIIINKKNNDIISLFY